MKIMRMRGGWPSRLLRWGAARIDLETVQTNIVIFRPEVRTAAEIVAGLKAKGVLCGTAGADEVRFVTHRDVDRAACERAMSGCATSCGGR